MDREYRRRPHPSNLRSCFSLHARERKGVQKMAWAFLICLGLGLPLQCLLSVGWAKDIGQSAAAHILPQSLSHCDRHSQSVSQSVSRTDGVTAGAPAADCHLAHFSSLVIATAVFVFVLPHAFRRKEETERITTLQQTFLFSLSPLPLLYFCDSRGQRGPCFFSLLIPR